MADLEKAKAFYRQGIRFADCAERSMGEVNEDGSIQIVGGRYEFLGAPVMVNAAFACEVFLKAILIACDIDYNSILKGNAKHMLKRLYDLLPEEEYKEFLRVGEKEEFEQELEKHSADFIDWRYFMEQPGEYRMRPQFTMVLAENLQELAKEVLE